MTKVSKDAFVCVHCTLHENNIALLTLVLKYHLRVLEAWALELLGISHIWMRLGIFADERRIRWRLCRSIIDLPVTNGEAYHKKN